VLPVVDGVAFDPEVWVARVARAFTDRGIQPTLAAVVAWQKDPGRTSVDLAAFALDLALAPLRLVADHGPAPGVRQKTAREVAADPIKGATVG
jgi:hypothetical protein